MESNLKERLERLILEGHETNHKTDSDNEKSPEFFHRYDAQSLTFGQTGRIVVGVGQLIHFSQSHFTKENKTRIFRRRREAVVGRLGTHVGEVNALNKVKPYLLRAVLTNETSKLLRENKKV